jgi:hypothetical protein
MRAQLKGRTFFFMATRYHRYLKTHFTGVLNGHVAQSPHPENSDSVACPGAGMTQRVKGSRTGAENRGGMHGREFCGNSDQRGITHDNVLGIAAIAAETWRQLVFAKMKKSAATGVAVLTVTAQTPDPDSLAGLPDIGHPVALARNVSNDFMSRDTPGLALLRRFFRVPEIGTAYSACINFDKHLIRAGSGYRSLCHFQHTGGNDLHSAIFFIHKLHR